MMPGNVFCLQVSAAFEGRRRLILRMGISALLALPFILVAMPAGAQAAGLVMVILFTSFFGAATSHAQLRHDLRLGRLTLLPTSHTLLWLDLVLASMVARILPALIILACFVLINGQGVTLAGSISLIAWLCGSLGLLVLLGMGTAKLARNNAEVHLFGMLACAVLAFFSNVTPLPTKLSWLKSTTFLNPIAQLLTAIKRFSTESVPVSNYEFIISSFIIGAIAVLIVWRSVSGWELAGPERQERSRRPA